MKSVVYVEKKLRALYKELSNKGLSGEAATKARIEIREMERLH